MKKVSGAKAIDLFCGAGGLTLGLKQAGIVVVAAVELDEVAAESYRKNHPEVTLFQTDIRKLSPTEVMRATRLKVGELDILAGCPPCQGFSSLRTNNRAVSVRDGRNRLMFEFVRFVRAMRPKSIMMENVPALAKGRRIRTLLRELQDLGYLVDQNSVNVVDAADYGVPQRRKRMILQASRFGYLTPAAPTHRKTVRFALREANLPDVGEAGDPLHDFVARRSPKVMEIIKAIPKDGGSRFSLPNHLVLPCHRNERSGFRDVYGRMKLDEVAPTITGGCGNPSKGRFIHPTLDRAISLREAAVLQTFPTDYHFSLRGGRGRAALMIGNALPPRFIAHHASELLRQLSRMESGHGHGKKS